MGKGENLGEFEQTVLIVVCSVTAAAAVVWLLSL